jgi:hypothetical protein
VGRGIFYMKICGNSKGFITDVRKGFLNRGVWIIIGKAQFL